jgi:hypothetical protein
MRVSDIFGMTKVNDQFWKCYSLWFSFCEIGNFVGVNTFSVIPSGVRKIYFSLLSIICQHTNSHSTTTRKSAFTKIHNWKKFFLCRLALFIIIMNVETFERSVGFMYNQVELITPKNIKYAFIHDCCGPRPREHFAITLCKTTF